MAERDNVSDTIGNNIPRRPPVGMAIIATNQSYSDFSLIFLKVSDESIDSAYILTRFPLVPWMQVYIRYLFRWWELLRYFGSSLGHCDIRNGISALTSSQGGKELSKKDAVVDKGAQGVKL